jgi:hypothetical protein
MMNNIGLTGMVIMFIDGVHRVGGRGALLVNAGNGAVSDRASIVPGYFGTDGYRFKRWCFFRGFLERHEVSPSINQRAVANRTNEVTGA